MSSTNLRNITKVFTPPEEEEGVGAKVIRILGN